jgi:autotransporter passenger strand-loop-strand repeat protein
VNDNGFQYVYSGGAASNTVLNDPGGQITLAGGLASGAILSGGRQVVFGNVGGTIIGSDGLQVVESGGVASGSILQAGGTSYIYSFGQEVGAQISGGNSDVFGNATRDTIFAGSQVVESGGTASNTAVFSGGVEVVSSGGTAVVTTISGGKEELAAGAVASGAITFAGTGGTLKIDGTVMPANVVSGFVEGDTFDLAGVAFRSGGTVQVVSGHVLQVVENATTYNLQLDSSVSYATDAFRLTSDGSGGTDVIIHGPALSNIATSASYTEEGGAITLATSGTITDQDSTTLVGATVAITGGTFANDADVLAATTSGTSITASYSSGTETLTLSGTDTLAHYQQVLRSVSFVAGENPTNYGNNPTAGTVRTTHVRGRHQHRHHLGARQRRPPIRRLAERRDRDRCPGGIPDQQLGAWHKSADLCRDEPVHRGRCRWRYADPVRFLGYGQRRRALGNQRHAGYDQRRQLCECGAALTSHLQSR